jgi:hypothetical protein
MQTIFFGLVALSASLFQSKLSQSYPQVATTSRTGVNTHSLRNQYMFLKGSFESHTGISKVKSINLLCYRASTAFLLKRSSA